MFNHKTKSEGKSKKAQEVTPDPEKQLCPECNYDVILTSVVPYCPRCERRAEADEIEDCYFDKNNNVARSYGKDESDEDLL